MRTFLVTKPGGDVIRIAVLDDGTIKTDNDAISQPNHSNAEGFLREVARLAGGSTDIRAKSGHLHTHSHGEHHHTH